MELAAFVVQAVLVEGRSVREVARAHGVSKTWLYELLARYHARRRSGPRRPLQTALSLTNPCPRTGSRTRSSRSETAHGVVVEAGPDTIHTHLAQAHGGIAPAQSRASGGSHTTPVSSHPSRTNDPRAPTSASKPRSPTSAGRWTSPTSRRRTGAVSKSSTSSTTTAPLPRQPRFSGHHRRRRRRHLLRNRPALRLPGLSPRRQRRHLHRLLPPIRDAGEFRIRHDRVDQTGKVTLRYAGKLGHLGHRRAHRGHVLTLIEDRNVRVLTTDGQYIAKHRIDPDRTLPATTLRPGHASKRPVHDVSRHRTESRRGDSNP